MFDQLFKSEYLKNIATLMSGSVSAQLVLLVASPILSRLFTPSDFGIFALFVAVSTIFGMISNGRYEIAILLPDKDEDGFQIFQLCLWLAIIFSLISLIIFWSIQQFEWFQTSSIADYWYLLPFAIFLQGLIQAFTNLLNRHEQYLQISKSRLFGGIGLTVFSIGFGFFAFGPIGLILGKLIGQIVEFVVYALKYYELRPTLSSTNNWNFAEKLNLAKKYSTFLKFSTLEGLFNTFFKQIPVLG